MSIIVVLRGLLSFLLFGRFNFFYVDLFILLTHYIYAGDRKLLLNLC
jgi:hypothetical protein